MMDFFELYAFIILTSTLVLGINYFVIITRPLHPIPVRKRSSSSCYMDFVVYCVYIVCTFTVNVQQ